MVKMSLYMSRRHIEKVKVQIHSSVTTKQDGGDRSASRYGRLNLGDPQYPLNRRQRGLQGGSARFGEEQISCSNWDSNPESALDFHKSTKSLD